MSDNLAGKVVLVTGAGSGIGAATAIHLASLGAKLAINDVRAEGLEETLNKILQGGKKQDGVMCHLGDVSTDGVPEELVAKVMGHFGRLDVLFNNAGIYRATKITDQSMEDFDRLIKVNTRSVYRMCQVCYPHLKASGGNVVNLSSMSASRLFYDSTGYVISKAAVDHMTRALALELSSEGIRVNAVNPGFIETNLLVNSGLSREAHESLFEKYRPGHPLGLRLGRAQEVARAVAFLASNSSSSFVTGHCLMIDGGFSLNCPVPY